MVEINLLPQKERASTRPNLWSLGTWIWLPVLLLGLGIPWVINNGKASGLQRQIDATQGDIDALTPQKQQYDALVTQQTTLQQVTSVGQTLRDQKTYWSNDLAAFSRQLPQDSSVSVSHLALSAVTPTDLTNMQNMGIYVGKQITRKATLTGVAGSQQAIINFLNTFEKNPNFGVNFNNLQQDAKTGAYNFTADVGIVSAGTPNTGTAGAPGTTATGNSSASGSGSGPTLSNPTAPAAPPAPAAPATGKP